MKKEHCPYYQVNEEAKAEYESFMKDMRPELREQMEYFDRHPEEVREGEEESNLYPECYEFCKFLTEQPGHPGEYLTCCTCPGHTQILDGRFNINEII